VAERGRAVSLAPIATTKQLYTAVDLAAVISADLEARGVPCVVEVGEWDPEKMRGEPRCMIAFLDGSFGEPAGHYHPGAWWPIDTTPGAETVAAPLLDDAERFLLRIHAPAAPGMDSGAAAAHAATKELVRQVMAAVRRPHASPFRGSAPYRWPTSIPGYPAFPHGSLCEVTLTLASPVFDDKKPLVTATQIDIESSIVFGDGAESPAVPIEA
jgi:hypothetical protein